MAEIGKEDMKASFPGKKSWWRAAKNALLAELTVSARAHRPQVIANHRNESVWAGAGFSPYVCLYQKGRGASAPEGSAQIYCDSAGVIAQPARASPI
jgi:hypothetical protein